MRVARDACERAGRDPDAFIVTTSGGAAARDRDRLTELGVDRVVVFVRPPYVNDIARARELLDQ